jgi:gamma-glutamyltranspeptidase
MTNLVDKDYLDRQDKRTRPEWWIDSETRGIVVSAHYRASEAGVGMLEQGGNAIDSAVAVSVARSNASPTLVFTPNKSIAIGSTGSERMASGIFQVLVRLIFQDDFKAVSAPRLHCTPDRQVQYEPDRFSDTVLSALQRAEFTLSPYAEPWAFSAGGLQLACGDNTEQRAVADPRRDGAAFGIHSL